MKNEVALTKKSLPPRKKEAMPATLLEIAVANNADIDRLRELMDLQERWEKKEARKAFFDALSKFQTMVPVLRKARTANVKSDKGGFTYKYADLGSITNGIKEPLRNCGLSYRWEFEENAGKLKVTCLISHRDGHTETTVMEAGMDNSGSKNDIQKKGSTQTYLQRYTLIGALGLSTADEDNDGQGYKSTPLQQQPKQERTEEEILDQWKQSVSQVNNLKELSVLYLKNQKVVNANASIQAIFKSRETELKGVKPANIDMP